MRGTLRQPGEVGSTPKEKKLFKSRTAHGRRVAVGGRRQMMSRKKAAIAGLLSMSLFLAACGGGDSSDGNGDVPEVAKNQTLTVGVATLQQQYVDPVLANEGGNTYALKWSVGEPLIRQDLDLKPIPALATDWEISDDGRTWTFNLREGVKMHDGSDFTAQDVATSIERVKNPDFSSYASYIAKIDSVEVIDDLTIAITSTVPYANLGYDTPAPVATDYYNEVGEEEFRKEPIAAGPFKFESQAFNDSITLTRFADFWDKDRIANFETLILKIVPEESSRISGLQAGQLDVAIGLTPNGMAQLENADGIELLRSPNAQTATVHLVDNYHADSDSKLKDVRVRRALLLAIDRQAIADSLYKGLGSVPANTTYSVTPGHDESLEVVPFDPDEAKKLLAEADAEDLSFEITSYNQTSAYPDVQKFTEAVAGYWNDLGLDVKVNIMDPATYLDLAVKHQLPGAIVLSVPALLVSDPAKFSLFYSSKGAYTSTQDPKFDQLFAELDSKVDPDEQEAVAQEIGRYAYETLYVLPVVRLDAVNAVGPKVAEWIQMESNPYAGPFWYLRAN